MKFLIVGYNVRHIACSAARSGHEVFAADCFCDLDLEGCAKDVVLLPKTLNVEQAERLIQTYVEEFSPEAMVLGPGLEETRVRSVRVLNNLPEKAALVSDKLWLAGWLEKRGYPFIETSESTESARFPVVVKPRKGAGGVGCKLVGSAAELKLDEGMLDDSMIVQDWLDGKPASVSVIGNGYDSLAISSNEQLIGAAWAGATGFRYSGNITPLEPPQPDIAEMAEEIVSELGLIGSNGVDFLLTKRGPVVVEVNPRFQGSLDAVELSTGINIFKAHAEAFNGVLPEKPLPRKVAGRAILFAQRSVKIGGELTGWIKNIDWITDVPRPGTEIDKNDPVTSVLAIGKDREEVLRLLIERTDTLRTATNSQN